MKSESFEKRFTNFENEMQEQHKQSGKDASATREIIERLRKKNEANGTRIMEVSEAVDSKMSSKEGLKLWSNFKKYAQYDELKDLYKKCLPAISGFEDKLKIFMVELNKFELMIRRIDEVMCSKADKTKLKEFINEVTSTYITKDDSKDQSDRVNSDLDEFRETVDRMEQTVKFQAKQIQKEMFSAVRRVVA